MTDAIQVWQFVVAEPLPGRDNRRVFGQFIPAGKVRRVLWAAVLLALCLGVWLAILLPQGPDYWYYRYWSRLVTLQGISAAYSGEHSQSYVDYPPVLLYPWKVVGELYRAFVDAEFGEDEIFRSKPLSFGLAMISLGFHLSTGLAIFFLSRRRFGERAAVAAAACYLLNPAGLYIAGYLGLPDTAHSFWLVMAFGLAELGHSRAGCAGAALAALTKPQAWGLMPLFWWRQLCTGGWRKTTVGALVAVVTGAIIALPFLFNGTFGQLLKLPTHMGNVQAVVSAHAHNLWWLVSLGDGLIVRDSTPLLGPVTYVQIALPLLVVSGLFVLWRARRATAETMLMLPAFQAFAWFCLSTRVHENHWYFVLPLAALALPTDRRMVGIFVAISVTGFFNLLLHDEHVEKLPISFFTQDVIPMAQFANSIANLTILGLWTKWLICLPARGTQELMPDGLAADPSPPASGK